MATISNPQPSQQPLIISYMTLRKGVGFLGLFLVPILVQGSLLNHPPETIYKNKYPANAPNQNPARLHPVCPAPSAI